MIKHISLNIDQSGHISSQLNCKEGQDTGLSRPDPVQYLLTVSLSVTIRRFFNLALSEQYTLYFKERLPQFEAVYADDWITQKEHYHETL